jgi:DNA polymerase III psi subunit
MLEWMSEYSRILLVGEGNFSFTIALLTNIMNAQQCTSIQVLSSCYQKYSHLAQPEKQNAKEANRLGKPNSF